MDDIMVLLASDPKLTEYAHLYTGAVCPKCNRFAFAKKAGHEPGCRYGIVGTPGRRSRSSCEDVM